MEATAQGPGILVMDQRYVWDPSHLKEIDEAKATIMDLKRRGFAIFQADGVTPMDKFLPSMAAVVIKAQKVIAKHVMKILCPAGDERVVWDKDNGQEAMQAKERFKDLLKKKYKAYSVDARGKKNRPIEEFDVDAEEILMVPPTSAG